MTGYATPTPERDAQLLDIGHQCSAPSCLLHDFLPFKCQHCNQRFCAEHFMPDSHKCEKYDATKFNRVAPNCMWRPIHMSSGSTYVLSGPLCNTPVAIPPGQDPNVRMERHISSECSVSTGKTKSSSVPRCTRSRCGKVLYSPIRCEVGRIVHDLVHAHSQRLYSPAGSSSAPSIVSPMITVVRR